MESRKLSLDSYLHQLVMRPGLIDSSSEFRTFLELDLARNDQKGHIVSCNYCWVFFYLLLMLRVRVCVLLFIVDVVMTVHMLDNSKKTFKIKSSARSADVAALMAQKLRLNQRLATTFMLFVSTSTTERSLQVRKNKTKKQILSYFIIIERRMIIRWMCCVVGVKERAWCIAKRCFDAKTCKACQHRCPTPSIVVCCTYKQWQTCWRATTQATTRSCCASPRCTRRRSSDRPANRTSRSRPWSTAICRAPVSSDARRRSGRRTFCTRTVRCRPPTPARLASPTSLHCANARTTALSSLTRSNPSISLAFLRKF